MSDNDEDMKESDSDSEGWDEAQVFERPDDQRPFDWSLIDNQRPDMTITVPNPDYFPVEYDTVDLSEPEEDSDLSDSEQDSDLSESILINAIKDISNPLMNSFTDEEEFDKAIKTISKEDYAKLINDVVHVYDNERKRHKYSEETKKEIENDFKTIIVPKISRMISPIIIDIFFNSNMYTREKKEKEIDSVLYDFFQNETTVSEVKKSQNDLINWLLYEWKKFQESPELEKIVKEEKDLSRRKATYFEEDIEADDDYYITVNNCLINDDCYMFIHDGDIIMSYSRNQIKKWIRDYLTTWRYWCVEKTLVERRKELGLKESKRIHPNDRVEEVHKDSFTYINLPISPSHETVLVPLHKLFSILHNYNNRILYPILIKTLDATSNFENLYASSDRSRGSANHCQNGTQSHLYDLKICGGGDCHIFDSRDRKR
jgi:hypothetical protein